MWARRCGCRPLWPSRVKVLLQSLAVALVGAAFFNFMNQIDIGWLDLASPTLQHPICMSRWPLRHEKSSWLRLEIWVDWAMYRLDTNEWMASHMCANATKLEAMWCANAQIPIESAQQNLGMPIGSAYVYANDFIEVFAHLLMWFSFWLWAYMTVHDLALTSLRNRNYILDLAGIKSQFPCAMRIWVLLGMRHLRLLGKGRFCGSDGGGSKMLARVTCCVLIPFVIVWDAIVYVVVFLPAVIFAFVWHPIKMSRAMVFLACIALAVVGVALVVIAIIFIVAPEMRQSYAVTWHQDDCVCGCSYPVAQRGFSNALLLGVGIVYKSLMIAFRCLKGLRRSNWATLISVLFPVPLNVYSVVWTRPDGSTIQHRKSGEPVQGEVAFDPFALMDEQPESAMTCLTLKPTLIKGAVSDDKDDSDVGELTRRVVKECTLTPSEKRAEMAAASYKANDSFEHRDGVEYLGCCGFPCIKPDHKTVRGPTCNLQGVAEMRAVAEELRDQARHILERAQYLEHRAASFESQGPAKTDAATPAPGPPPVRTDDTSKNETPGPTPSDDEQRAPTSSNHECQEPTLSNDEKHGRTPSSSVYEHV